MLVFDPAGYQDEDAEIYAFEDEDSYQSEDDEAYGYADEAAYGGEGKYEAQDHCQDCDEAENSDSQDNEEEPDAREVFSLQWKDALDKPRNYEFEERRHWHD